MVGFGCWWTLVVGGLVPAIQHGVEPFFHALPAVRVCSDATGGALAAVERDGAREKEREGQGIEKKRLRGGRGVVARSADKGRKENKKLKTARKKITENHARGSDGLSTPYHMMIWSWTVQDSVSRRSVSLAPAIRILPSKCKQL